MYYKSYSDLINDIKAGFSLLYSHHFDLVVGIPRSGMIPAYMISLGLNVNCTTVQAFIKNEELSHGSTRKAANKIRFPQEASRVLLVDDSIQSGSSLKGILNEIPPELKTKITSLVVYGVESVRTDVDIILKRVPLPRMFEWNIFHHSKFSEFCIDMDILVSLNPEYKYGPNDRFKLEKTFILPNNNFHSLVTGIPEEYRKKTEQWLMSQNIKFDNLIMYKANNAEGEIGTNNHKNSYYHKAVYYKQSNLLLYITNDPLLAKAICEIATKPVFCAKNNTMYNPGKVKLLIKDPLYIPRESEKFYHRTKKILKLYLHQLFNRLTFTP